MLLTPEVQGIYCLIFVRLIEINALHSFRSVVSLGLLGIGASVLVMSGYVVIRPKPNYSIHNLILHVFLRLAGAELPSLT